MRILYGLHQPDEGRILRDGAEELGLLLAGVYPAKQKGREQERNSLAGRRGRLLEPLNGSPSNTLVSKRRGLARRLADNAFYKPVHAQHLAVFQELDTVLARQRTAEYVHLTGNDHGLLFGDQAPLRLQEPTG